MTRPSKKTQKRRTLEKLILNTMNQYETGTTFDDLAEGVADTMMNTIFLEADNGELFWDQYYSLISKNKLLTKKNAYLTRKYKRVREVNKRLQERCLEMRDRINA